MKRFSICVLALLLALSVLAAADVRVAAMKGPTAMGLVGLMDKAKEGPVNGNSYTFQLESAPDAVVPLIVRGDVDISAIPGNLASTLYNRTKGGIEVLGINTLGVLYIVGAGDTVQSVSDLRGKTLYANGRGATPEYSLLYVLKANGLEPGKDVFIEWKSEAAEVVTAITADKAAVAMLPQPFATSAMMQKPELRIVFNLNDLWKDAVGLDLLTGVTIVQKAFLEENPEAVAQFLKDYAESVEYVNTDPDAAASVASYGIVGEKVAAKAIPFCSIVLITGEEMKDSFSFYLDTLYAQNPQIVGGKVPADDFYYTE